MTLTDFAAQLNSYRLASEGDRLDVFIAAFNRDWTLNIYASEGAPAVRNASFDEAEAAAAIDVNLVYLTR